MHQCARTVVIPDAVHIGIEQVGFQRPWLVSVGCGLPAFDDWNATDQDDRVLNRGRRSMLLLDPGAQVSGILQVGHRVLVAAARHAVTHHRPAVANQVQRESIQARVEARGDGFIDDDQGHSLGFLGRQVEAGGPVSTFELFLAGT